MLSAPGGIGGAPSARPFSPADRPWERARFIVSGQALPGLADDEIAWAEGPLARS